MKASGNLEIKAFLSYNSKDKVIAGRVKVCLEQYGVSVFLAHSDLEGGVQWEREIISQIRTCDVFLPFLTSQFRESQWTDQEVGVGIASSRVIIPLSVKGLKPHGFLARYQAFKFDLEGLNQSCRSVLLAIKNNKKLREKVQNSFIERFVRSGSFIEANELSGLLEDFGPYGIKQVNRIFLGYLQNSQIHQATTASRIVRDFLLKHRRLIKVVKEKKNGKLIRVVEERKEGKAETLTQSELEGVLRDWRTI